MKTSKNIISHISSLSNFQNIQTLKHLNRITSILPPHLQKINIINFMYIRGTTLFIALNHSGYKMEIDMQLRTLKPIIYKMNKMIEGFPIIENITTFAIHKSLIHKTKQNEKKFEDISFEEKSKGNFFINTTDDKLKDIFKEIQKVIKNV